MRRLEEIEKQLQGARSLLAHEVARDMRVGRPVREELLRADEHLILAIQNITAADAVTGTET